MSGEFYTEITFRGPKEKQQIFLDVLQSFEAFQLIAKHRNSRRAKKIDTEWDDYFYIHFFDRDRDIKANGEELEAKFEGPHGRFYDPVHTGFYQKLAESVPDMFFTGTTSGYNSGGRITLEAELKDGRLSLRQKTVDNDRSSGYFQIAEQLPLQKVQALFHLEDVRDEVDIDELDIDELVFFDEDSYTDWVGEAVRDGTFPTKDYQSFLKECPYAHIDEQEYQKALKEIESLFLEEYVDADAFTYIEEFVYDPAAKEYIQK